MNAAWTSEMPAGGLLIIHFPGPDRNSQDLPVRNGREHGLSASVSSFAVGPLTSFYRVRACTGRPPTSSPT